MTKQNNNNLKKANHFLKIELTHKDSLDAKNQKETSDWLIAKNELEHQRLENRLLKDKEIAQFKLLSTQRIIVGCLLINAHQHLVGNHQRQGLLILY